MGPWFPVLLSVLFPVLLAMDEYLVGGTVHVNEPDRKTCTAIKYRSNYKPLTINVEASADLSWYLITDVLDPDCPGECSEDAKYCVRGGGTSIHEEMTLCNDWVYVYLYPRKDHISATISVSYNQGWACEGIERNPIRYCQLMSPQECLESCDQGCSLVHCLKSKAALAVELFSLCLPSTTPTAEKERRCKAHNEAKTISTDECLVKDAGGLSLSWVIFLVAAVPTLIFFIGNIIYYRCTIAKKGTPPFEVPEWCPQTLYPRRNVEEDSRLQRFSQS